MWYSAARRAKPIRYAIEKSKPFVRSRNFLQAVGEVSAGADPFELPFCIRSFTTTRRCREERFPLYISRHLDPPRREELAQLYGLMSIRDG